MIGVIRVSRRHVPPDAFTTYRLLTCSICVGLRTDLGFYGPLIHRDDLAVLALLGSGRLTGAVRRRCSAIPLLNPRVLPGDHPFILRLRALAVVMALLKRADDRRDGEHPGLRTRLIRLVTDRRTGRLLSRLGLGLEDLTAVDGKIGRVEARMGLPVDQYIQPMCDFAGRLFERLFEDHAGLPGDPVGHLGRAYIEMLYFLDAIEDREADLQRGRFNLCTDPVYAEGDGPARRLRSATETFARTALSLAPPRNRVLVRAALDHSLGPRIMAAIASVSSLGGEET